MNTELIALVRRIWRRAYLDSEEECARWIVEYIQKESNSHKHSVMQAEGSDESEGAAVASEGKEKCVCVGFDEGYKRGYQDATSEAIEEIHKNYKPRA